MTKGFLLGNHGSSSYNNTYKEPSDWIDINDCAEGNIQLLASDMGGYSGVSFQCITGIPETGFQQGRYKVDWGDGTVEIASGISSHVYTIGSGKPCSKGYTTFKVVISPEGTDKIIGFNNRPYVVDTGLQIFFGFLKCVCNVPTFIDMISLGGYDIYGANVVNRLESFIQLGSTPRITSTQEMFYNCFNLRKVVINDLSLATNAYEMFYNCQSLEYVNISSMKSITNSSRMFYNCYRLKSIDLTGINNITVTDFMFYNARDLQKVKFGIMSSVTSAVNMFLGCNSLESIDTSGFTALTNSYCMFKDCSSLQCVDISNLASLSSAESMFYNCRSLNRIIIGSLPALTRTISMFSYCYSLQSINISGLTNVSLAKSMFYCCYELKDITAINFGSATETDLTSAFYHCSKLISVYLPTTKITSIGIQGDYPYRNNTISLIFNSASTFASGGIDISYCAFGASQLNSLFTALPTVSGKTIYITGCLGASTCDKTIATNKGWKVNG